MPSTSITPAQFAYTGGAASFIPARETIAALAIVFTGGTVTMGPGDGTSLAVTTPELDRAADLFPIGEIRNGQVYYTAAEQNRQQRVLEAIELAFEALSTQVGDNSTLIAQIQAAMNLASAANDNAVEVTRAVNIADSYTSPLSVLTASNDGSITIAAHSRVYADGTSVDVDAGSVSGFAAGSYVAVYYNDAARAGGAVTYQGTIDLISQTGDTHIVGQVTIPQVGEPPAEGGGSGPPGWKSQQKALIPL